MGFSVVDGRRAMELGSVGPMREHPNNLVLAGLKKATAGTLDDYGMNPTNPWASNLRSSTMTSKVSGWSK